MSLETLRWFRSGVILRSLMVVVTLCGPVLSARATEPIPTAADHLTAQSIAALTIKPAQLISHPNLELLPTEVIEAASQKYLGISSTSIGRITAIAEPPLGMQPYYAVVVDLTEPLSLAGLNEEVLDALNKVTTSTSLNGRPFYESKDPTIPCLYMPTDYKLIAAPRGMLDKMLKLAAEEPAEDAKPNPLVRAMNGGGGAENDAHFSIMLKPIQPLIQMGMMAARSEVEPQYHKYLDMVGLLNGVVATLDMSGIRASYLRAYANSEEDADKLDVLMTEGLEEVRSQVFNDPTGPYAQMVNSDDPLQQAAAQYMERLQKRQTEMYRPIRLGKKSFNIANAEPGDTLNNPMVMVAVVGILVALLLPAVQAAREAARRNHSMNNMKSINLALHNYHDVNNSFPAQAITDEDGNPLLSWRVAILPFLEENELYQQFHLDEAWDSEHNLKLVSQMPEIFTDPSNRLAAIDGKSHYLGVSGENSLFTGRKNGLAFRSLVDGTAKTLSMVQVNDENAVTWTKPADYVVADHQQDPVAGIGSPHPGVFLAGFCDGHVSAISLDVDPELFHAMTTINGREPIDLP